MKSYCDGCAKKKDGLSVDPKVTGMFCSECLVENAKGTCLFKWTDKDGCPRNQRLHKCDRAHGHLEPHRCRFCGQTWEGHPSSHVAISKVRDDLKKKFTVAAEQLTEFLRLHGDA